MNGAKMSVVGAVAFGLSATAALGETYTYVGGADSKPPNTAYTNAKYWKDSQGNVGEDGAALDPAGDYLVTGGLCITAPSGADYAAFPCNSLSLGAVGGTYGDLSSYNSGNGRKLSFGAKGLFLNSGSMYLRWMPQEIIGDVTVRSFQICPEYNNTTFTLSGALHGESTAKLTFRSWWWTGPSGFKACLTGDMSDYLGEIQIGADNWAAAACQLGCAVLPGKLTLKPSSDLSLTLGTNHVSIGTLTVGKNSSINIGGAYWKEDGVYKGETGLYTVTTAFSATGPIYVKADKGVVIPDGQAHKVPVLTVPSSATLNAADFVFVPCVKSCVQFGETVVDEDAAAGTKTLSIQFEPVVLQEVLDKGCGYSSTSAPSSLTDATHWSDGKLPHAGAHYLVLPSAGATVGSYKFTSQTLRTRSGTVYDDIWSSAYNDTFAGDSLSIGDGAYLAIVCKKFTVKKLRLLDGGGIAKGQWLTNPKLGGALEIVSGTSYIGTMDGATLDVEASVTGSGSLRLPGPLTGWGSRSGSVRFTDISGYTGQMTVMEFAEQETGSGQGHWPSYNASYQTLLLKNAASYGGTMAALNYFGVKLGRYTRLTTEAAEVTIPASLNRGLYVEGTYGGILNIGQTNKGVPHRLNLNVPLTLNGTMVKDGAGTLALGGDVRFGGSATATPGSANNIIQVRKGKLMATAAESLDGVKIAFSNDTQLVVKLDPNDAGLATYGLKNVKTTTPFAYLGTMTKLPLAVDASACAGMTAESFTCGLLTVTNTIADSVRAQLPESLSVKVRGYQRPTLVEIDRAEIGLTTFALKFERTGLFIYVR